MKNPFINTVKLFKYLVVLIILGVLLIFFFNLDFTPKEESIYGTTFSKKYAVDLELDWRQSYLAILDELKVDNIRLIAYWDEIEKVQDELDFSELDWQIDQAEQRNVNIILALGRRTPRWPECHDPSWLSKLSSLSGQQQQLEFVRQVVQRYSNRTGIKFWQVENEPLFAWFGHCPRPSKEFLTQEVNLVRSIDSRPIILTDSGELNHWQGVGSLADTLGITLYRVVWNKHLGFWDYFFVPPALYHYKSVLTLAWQKNLKDIIVTELQMEPWTLNKRMVDLTIEEQELTFDLQRFRENIDYARTAGFSELYLWGAEYWYWLKENGHPEIWEEAKTLWN